MRTLVRHTQTGFYFQAPGTWTEDPVKAYDFRFIDRATQFIAVWDLREVELVFAFTDPISITTIIREKAASRTSA